MSRCWGRGPRIFKYRRLVAGIRRSCTSWWFMPRQFIKKYSIFYIICKGKSPWSAESWVRQCWQENTGCLRHSCLRLMTAALGRESCFARIQNLNLRPWPQPQPRPAKSVPGKAHRTSIPFVLIRAPRQPGLVCLPTMCVLESPQEKKASKSHLIWIFIY